MIITTKQLTELLDQGKQPIIKFIKRPQAFDEVEVGMMAQAIRYATDCKDTPDEYYAITFDFSNFNEINDPLMRHDFYDKSGSPCLTPKEAGYWKDQMEDFTVPSDRNYEIIDEQDMKLYNEYKASGDKISYVAWLEGLVGELRKNS